MRTWETGTVELAPGVFSYLQAGGGLCVANAGIVAGAEGVTAIDALFTPDMTTALLAEAARVSTKPIARLINTHHHVDHTLGNALFPPETEILAHAKAKAEMERVGLGVLPRIKQIAPHFGPQIDEVTAQRLPDATFDGDALDLTFGDRRARLMHFGTGHTRGDILIFLPEERLLFAGDVAFFFVTPLAFEGHIGNWLRVGERIIDEIDADVIVPGHGPVGDKNDLRRMLDYLELVHVGARRAFDAGASEAEAIGSIELGEFAEWGEPERISFNVGRCYQEFRGELDAFV